ncbi:MAG: hypothetical protein FWB73_00700 [Treponema sp.]|nr:hypothetical protein [Treponema sp.]
MKKLFFVIALIIIASSFAFADFEGSTGLYAGFGTAASAGCSTQLGYISLAVNGTNFRWSILADLGIGFRYGSGASSAYDDIPKDENLFTLDFFMGVLAEFYFLPFMGVAIGCGVTPGFVDKYHNEWFQLYSRIQIPFWFKFAKLNISFDFIYNSAFKAHTSGSDALPLLYRITLSANFRWQSLERLLNPHLN